MRICVDDMDLQTTEIKQEVEEHDGADKIVDIKLEQSYSNQCDGIKVEQIAENSGEANLTTDAVDQVKMEDQPAVVVKCEKLEEEPDIDNTKVENMDASEFDEELNIKSEEDPATTSDSAPVSSTDRRATCDQQRLKLRQTELKLKSELEALEKREAQLEAEQQVSEIRLGALKSDMEVSRMKQKLLLMKLHMLKTKLRLNQRMQQLVKMERVEINKKKIKALSKRAAIAKRIRLMKQLVRSIE